MIVELLGIFNGLNIAKAASFCTVACETNSQIALQMISQGNACSDWLAKTGANPQDNLRLISSCPSPMHYLLIANAMGSVFLRV
ncbi:hypothetical protein JHK82_011454 [Glycine max]|uniref:Uncharacterized protein n=1 Tax=Glycine max TaxID=3847 RepID=A0A0R0JPP2_SOYBN|nr:hypothetical protein JHK85_011772 [Glycine max]KAG5153485.1 hypothetical protein JHK82_011454 [Glycine max]